MIPLLLPALLATSALEHGVPLQQDIVKNSVCGFGWGFLTEPFYEMLWDRDIRADKKLTQPPAWMPFVNATVTMLYWGASLEKDQNREFGNHSGTGTKFDRDNYIDIAARTVSSMAGAYVIHFIVHASRKSDKAWADFNAEMNRAAAIQRARSEVVDLIQDPDGVFHEP